MAASKAQKYTRQCVVCGKEFTTTRSNKRTCSHECGRKWQSDSTRRAYHRAKTHPRVCPNCGRTFIGAGAGPFCSDRCRAAHYRRAAMSRMSGGEMSCPWANGTISDELRGVSPTLGF